ncbi:uncharacterized protein B0T15DRAFT_215208 [Chaetomium strumarium]|uniref:Uncharacterized protein n=1 Tax=Chaetomium strumarium TaxID=1170767 RepID=A0AAJ0GTN7_9PEZI|nr:hypothetical protein B0T15DRAFT_215208 [Chaetomium strumarium]
MISKIATNTEKEHEDMSDTETIFTEESRSPVTFWDHTAIRNAVPCPGETFIIVEKASGRAITQINGELQLEPDTSRRGGFYWACVETEGWLGFYNTASGNFMGHNARGKILATAKHHKAWEYFCARRHPAGGYVLLVTTHGRGWKLEKVAIDQDGNGLVPKDHESAVWEFVKVQNRGPITHLEE